MLNTNKKLKYDRYLTVRVFNGNNNSYSLIKDYNRETNIKKLKNKSKMQPINMASIFNNKLYPEKIGNLPNNGHISIAVPIQDINNHIVTDDYIKILNWISDLKYRGKLRLSVHGSLYGTFSNDSSYSTKANNFILWMIKNGLRRNLNIVNNNEIQKTGLITLCLLACTSASYMSQKGIYDNELKQFQSALNSSIDLMIKCLQSYCYFGIQITGSSEIITILDDGKRYRHIPDIPTCLETKYDPIHFSSLPQKKASRSKSFCIPIEIFSRKLKYNLPISWKASTNNITKETYIYIPDIYNISPAIQNKFGDINGDWVLHHDENNPTYAPTVLIPYGWQLDLITRTIHPPIGWTAKITSNGLHYLEGIQTKVQQSYNRNSKLEYFELISHSEAKIRQISNNPAQNDQNAATLTSF